MVERQLVTVKLSHHHRPANTQTWTDSDVAFAYAVLEMLDYNALTVKTQGSALFMPKCLSSNWSDIRADEWAIDVITHYRVMTS